MLEQAPHAKLAATTTAAAARPTAKVIPIVDDASRPLSDRPGRMMAIFPLAAIALGILQAFASSFTRHYVGGDGVAYLDTGDAYLRGDWATAINGHWSPLYAWLLALVRLVVKPSPYWEYPVVCLVNFAVYLFALGCFHFFLRELINYQRTREVAEETRVTLPEWAWLALGYTLFTWSSLDMILLRHVTPDMCVAAFVYLASGILLRIRLGSTSWLTFIVFGVVLGVGYLAKAPMFPLAFIFLGVSLFLFGDLRRAAPRVLAALIVFFVVSSPFIVALSKAKGRLTWGDSAKLNYSWFVNLNHTNFTESLNPNWQGEIPGSGTPLHPTRKIFEAPAAYEFGTPIEVTYPPWYDPSYWYDGVAVRFDFVGHIKAVGRGLKFYYSYFFDLHGSLVIGLLILFYVGARKWSITKDILRSWHLLVPATAALGMYALVAVEPRYVAPFIALFFLGLFSSVSLPASQESRRLVAGVIIIIMAMFLITTGAPIFRQAGSTARNLIRGQEAKPDLYWEVADGLKQFGVQRGDKVATIGTGIMVYWARMAGVRVVAEIPVDESDEFWEAEDSIKTQVMEAFRKSGAKMIVASQVPDLASTAGWQRIGMTPFYVYSLNPVMTSK